MVRSVDGAGWRAVLGVREFWWKFGISSLGLFAGLFGQAKMLSFVEKRPGAVLMDPILALLPPKDVTWMTFTLIYLGVVAGFTGLLPDPWRLVRAFGAYGFLALFRVLTMWVTPLDPPLGMILLRDPFVEAFVAVPVTTKDLFFSGHTSLLFLLFLSARGVLRGIFAAGALGVAVCVLIQHVHYTVDVLGAPFFALGAWVLSGWFFTAGFRVPESGPESVTEGSRRVQG